MNFAEGDILRFTANGKTLDGHQIRNGTAYKIAGFTAQGIRLENGWLVAKDFGHFKHGIETSPGSQSKTVSLAIVGQSSQSSGRPTWSRAYVTACRSRYTCQHLYRRQGSAAAGDSAVIAQDWPLMICIAAPSPARQAAGPATADRLSAMAGPAAQAAGIARTQPRRRGGKADTPAAAADADTLRAEPS